jgi:hypothetical protein
MPICAAISVSGLAVALRAISRSDGKPIFALSLIFCSIDATSYSTDHFLSPEVAKVKMSWQNTNLTLT